MIEQKTNPDLHIICGKCGCRSMFEYWVRNVINDNNETKPVVSISCGNCGTLTWLNEI